MGEPGIEHVFFSYSLASVTCIRNLKLLVLFGELSDSSNSVDLVRRPS